MIFQLTSSRGTVCFPFGKRNFLRMGESNRKWEIAETVEAATTEKHAFTHQKLNQFESPNQIFDSDNVKRIDRHIV